MIYRDTDLPDRVQAQLKDMKYEVIGRKNAGDREGAKAKLREMNKLRSRTRVSEAAAAAAAASAGTAAAGEIDWESAAGEIDFDALYQKKKEDKAVVDEFGVDMATLAKMEEDAIAAAAAAAAAAGKTAALKAPAPKKARMMF